MAKRVLVVTKDIGEFNVYHPVVGMLRAAGIDCAVIAEGLSRQKWSDASYMTVSGEAFSELEIHDLFRNHKPDLVLTGLGAPINLGEKFGLAANHFGIKLGYVHDLWGVNKRSQAVPQFVCVTDTLDEKLVREYPAYNVCVSGRVPKIYVTGSPAMDALEGENDNPLLSEMINPMAGELQTVLVLGQDESTTPMLEGLVEALDVCVEASLGDYVLIPRLHPKFMKNDELRHRWLSILFGARRGKVLFVEPEVPTRQLMKVANFTVSVYSTGLLEAPYFESVPVSWVSRLGREKMKEALGMEQFPLVTMHGAAEVSTTSDWRSLWTRSISDRDDMIRHANRTLQTDGLATRRVVHAILKELD